MNEKVKIKSVMVDGSAAFHLTSSVKKRVLLKPISGACSCTIEICLP